MLSGKGTFAASCSFSLPQDKGGNVGVPLGQKATPGFSCLDYHQTIAWPTLVLVKDRIQENRANQEQSSCLCAMMALSSANSVYPVQTVGGPSRERPPRHENP